MTVSTISKRMKLPVLAFVLVLCTGVALVFQTPYSYASGAFGEYDQDWEEINHTFENFKHIGYEGNKLVYKSDVSTKTNTWSRLGESHEFGNYALTVRGNSVNLFYTKESSPNQDEDLVMKMNFSLYRISHPSEKYTFQVKRYDESDNAGREDSTGYLNDVRNPVGGDLVPIEYQDSTLSGLEYLYPTLFLDSNSLAEALLSGTWKIEFDSMHVYDDTPSSPNDGVAGYQVSFDANGGSGDLGLMPKRIVEEPYILSEQPECRFGAPEDMEFAGWALSTDGEVVEFPYTLTGDTMFYAIWKEVDSGPSLDSDSDTNPAPNSSTSGDTAKKTAAAGDTAGTKILAFGTLASAAAIACTLAARKRED